MGFALYIAGGAVLGAIIGSILEKIFMKNTKTHGVIEVDHNTEMCKVRITSSDLSDRKTKKAIFVVNHDVKISRDEQSL